MKAVTSEELGALTRTALDLALGRTGRNLYLTSSL